MQIVPLVKDVMSSNVLVTPPDTTVMDAARQMRSENRGSVVVMDKMKPVGIVTERDLFKRVVADGLVPKDVLVRDIMSSPLLSIGPGDTIKSAAKMMAEKEIRRLPVIEKNKLVGMITATDLARLEPHELL